MEFITVLAVTTKYEHISLNYYTTNKEIHLYSSIEKCLKDFEVGNYSHLELKKITENYYEFSGVDLEGYDCYGSIYLQILND